jgi:UDP-N-acetyl-D-mannosaminuronate dehydrogenase
VADRAVAALARAGRGIGGALVVVVGVSYKPGVRDVRSSSALEIIARLAALGAKVDYYDPLVAHVATPEGARLDSAVRPEGAAWDLALVHTVHPGHDYAWVADCPIVVDATYRFDDAKSGS